MRHLGTVRTGQIGNGARHLQGPVRTARRPCETRGSDIEKPGRRVVKQQVRIHFLRLQCLVQFALTLNGALARRATALALFVGAGEMIDLVATVRSQYDLVFFDSPPILGVSDASILASEVDIAIMVVQYRRFPRAMLQRVRGAVENVGGHILGIVLNNVETKHDSGYQYYTQYYDYYTPSAERKKRKALKQGAIGEAAPEKVTVKPGDY